MYILVIYVIHHKDIIIKNVQNKPMSCEGGIYPWVVKEDIIIKKGTEQTHELWRRYIPDILVRMAYYWNIPSIYQVYTMHIPVRFWYTNYIPRIFMVWTDQLPWTGQLPYDTFAFGLSMWCVALSVKLKPGLTGRPGPARGPEALSVWALRDMPGTGEDTESRSIAKDQNTFTSQSSAFIDVEFWF